MNIAKPTKQQLLWHELELGVLIHYCLEIYRPDLKGTWYKTDAVRTEIAPQTLHPTKLEPEQWVRSAAEMGRNMQFWSQTTAPVSPSGTRK